MTSLKANFNELLPGKVFLENGQVTFIEKYLKDRKWIEPDDRVINVEKPGEGNMNFVRRILTEKKLSFIIKQSRPWVEKYPHLSAPAERIVVEKTYYETIKESKTLIGYSPDLLHFDDENFIMVLEDLGEAADFSHVYKKDRHFTQTEITQAVAYLNRLGKISHVKSYPENKALRELNHQHIFHLPFIFENGFNLDSVQEGLQSLSEKAKSDTALKDNVAALGEIYLGKGTVLLQGDFYPGSLLKVKDSVKVIDPEFSFLGPAEWDIGVFMAHLFMSGASEDLIGSAYKQFDKREDFNVARFSGFVGVEILRRLIGLAQLPLEMELEQKARLIDQSMLWISNGHIDILEQ